MATRIDTSYTLVVDDDLVSMERGKSLGVPGVKERGRCCGSYLLVGDTHTEHKQQADRLANAEKRKKVKTDVQGRRLRCRPETAVHKAGDTSVEDLLVFLSGDSRLESSNPRKFGQ